jgi:hypothetical protein
LGGLRAEFPANRHALPYVLGGLGTARLKPNEQFMFGSGALPDGTVPNIGSDVTSTLETSGILPTPVRTNAFMYTLGGGVQVPVTTHWAADLGYRYSRIAADTAQQRRPRHQCHDVWFRLSLLADERDGVLVRAQPDHRCKVCKSLLCPPEASIRREPNGFAADITTRPDWSGACSLRFPERRAP